jgi:hypothetical protein
VLVDFKSLKVSSEGEIMDEMPFIYVVVRFNGSYFQPQKEALLIGTISYICESHISKLGKNY